MENETNTFGREEEKLSVEEEFKKKEKELKEKYGVIEEIPEREIEEFEPRSTVTSNEPRDLNLPDILLRVEKIDGKMEMLEDFKKGIDERIGTLSESVGELRSSLLEKEKFMSKVESDSENALEMVSQLEPEKIRKLFLKRDTEIEEIKANMEKLESMIGEARNEVKNFLGTMEKIKSFENLLKTAENIEKKISRIEETRDYSEKIAAKVEAIFSELSEKINQLQYQKEKIIKMDELTIDLVKMLDEISIKLTKFVDKEEFETLRREVNKKFEKLGQSKIEIKGKVDIKEEETWANLKEKWKNKLAEEQNEDVQSLFT